MESLFHNGRVNVSHTTFRTIQANTLFSAWWISGRDRPLAEFFGSNGTTSSNGTSTGFGLPLNATLYQRLSSRPFWSMLSTDIFAGQIIASLIVLIFVAVFLLREWISQNARPGVFEEEDGAVVPPAPQPADLPAPAIAVPDNVQIPNENGHVAHQALQQAAPDARHQRIMRARRGLGPAQRQGLRWHDPEEIEQNQPLRNRPLDRLPFPLEPALQPPQAPRDHPPPYESYDHARKGKGRAEEADDMEEGSDFSSQRRIRRRIQTDEDETMSRDSNDSQAVQPSTSVSGRERSTFPFTFKASSSIGSSSPEPFRNSDPIGPSSSKGKYAWNPNFQIDSQPTSSSASPPMTPSLHVDIGTPLRRPPMANSTVYAEGATPNKLQPSTPLPLSSPSLAMYLAPEELEVGSSSGPSGYFDGNERSNGELEEEFEHFFRGPDSPHLESPPSDMQDGAPIAATQDAPAKENDDEDDDDDDDDDEGDIPAPLPAAEVGLVREDEDDEDDDDEGDGEIINLRNENVPAAAQIQAALDQPGDMDDLEPGVEDDLDGAMEGQPTLFHYMDHADFPQRLD